MCKSLPFKRVLFFPPFIQGIDIVCLRFGAAHFVSVFAVCSPCVWRLKLKHFSLFKTTFKDLNTTTLLFLCIQKISYGLFQSI